MSKTQQASDIIQQELSKQTFSIRWISCSITRIEQECHCTTDAAESYFTVACQLLLKGAKQ